MLLCSSSNELLADVIFMERAHPHLPDVLHAARTGELVALYGTCFGPTIASLQYCNMQDVDSRSHFSISWSFGDGI